MNSENNKNKNNGFRYPYKEEMLLLSEVAKKAGCATSCAHKWVKDFNEKPENFIKRMQKRKPNKGK